VKWQKFPFKLEKQFRLPGWDYSDNGCYFVTICTHLRQNYFGNIFQNQMNLSEIGKICSQCWQQIPKHFGNIFLDKYVVMPNHLHGILIIKNPISTNSVHDYFVGTHHDAFLQIKDQIQKYTSLAMKSTQSISLSTKLFKSSVKRICNQKKLNFQWQPRFHDRIIRNEKEYFAKKQYIEDNPKN